MIDPVQQVLKQRDTALDLGYRLSMEQVRAWMQSENTNVQGIVFDLIFEHPDRIEIPTAEEIEGFFLDYLETCLRKGTNSEYVLSRYMAAHTLRAWFQRLWMAHPIYDETLQKIKKMLAQLASTGDKRVIDAIVTGLLEHLFVDVKIATFFESWRQDLVLAPVYQEAITLATT